MNRITRSTTVRRNKSLIKEQMFGT